MQPSSWSSLEQYMNGLKRVAMPYDTIIYNAKALVEQMKKHKSWNADEPLSTDEIVTQAAKNIHMEAH